MGKKRTLLLLAVPLGFTFLVYLPITRNYFFADDFLNLYNIVNLDPVEYLLTPHGGHILIARNAWFWSCFQAFGPKPAGYFWVALLTHLANVFLLFLVVRRFTGSERLACFGAALWGVSPVHEGTLGWYAVYGQAFAATMMLCILLGAARSRSENRPPARRTLALWYVFALIGCTSFGVSIGVAMVLPFALALLLPRSPGRPPWRLPLLSLVIVVPALYLGVHRLYAALSGKELLTGALVDAYVRHWQAVFPMLLHLSVGGIVELSLGFIHEPRWRGGWLSLLVFGLWTWGAIRVLRRGTKDERAELLAFLALLIGCYGMVAVGRASIYDSASPFGVGVQVAAGAPRYHYAATVPLTLILCLILSQIRLPGPSGARAARVALASWLGLAVAAWMSTAPWIDHHPASRRETREVLAAIRERVRSTPPGSDVRIPNRRFQDVGPLVPNTMFPGWAALFTIYFPSGAIDGRRVYFLEREPRVIDETRRGRRIAQVLLPAAVPSGTPAIKPGTTWFDRKMEEINRR